MCEKLKALGIKQVDLIFALRERGYNCSPSELSAILRGVLVTPKAKKVLDKVENIIAEHKQ